MSVLPNFSQLDVIPFPRQMSWLFMLLVYIFPTPGGQTVFLSFLQCPELSVVLCTNDKPFKVFLSMCQTLYKVLYTNYLVYLYKKFMLCSTILIPIGECSLWMRKPRLRGVKWLAHGHTTGKWQNQVLNWGLLISVFYTFFFFLLSSVLPLGKKTATEGTGYILV